LLDAAVIAGGLGARYTQPHRAYHTLLHVEDVLLRIQELEPPPECQLAVSLAAWFHDAVYAPGQPDNETRSAHVAYDALEQAGASPELITEVVRLVRLTEDHVTTPDDVAGATLCDADLAILGSTPERYRDYCSGIRTEYQHVPEAEFRAGRAAVLRTFLDRPHIYTTDYAQRRWEAPARANIGEEIQGLERGVS
jgi:predicted metal-dependent HD superfamily phosphohydrolase